jgi:serine/threonine protein kinase
VGACDGGTIVTVLSNVPVQQDATARAIFWRVPWCSSAATEGPMAEQPMADLSGRMLGEFILREQIGEGGHAVVYRCEQPVAQRDVVIKVLRARLRRNDAVQERFLNEAQLASRLDHPYAAHVYGFGAEDDGLLWIAMELVQGITLDEWLETHGPMPLEQFVPFFDCIAEVVHAAHERGIVHCDLRPSNVMVVERGGRLFPKLLDFGIAKVSHEVAAPRPGAATSAEVVVTSRRRVTPRRAHRTRTALGDSQPRHRARAPRGVGRASPGRRPAAQERRAPAPRAREAASPGACKSCRCLLPRWRRSR